MQRKLEITTLVEACRESCRSVAPFAAGIGIRWREPANYDEWDLIAKSIFESFVLAALRDTGRLANAMPFAQYDQRLQNYDQVSYVAARTGGGLLPFVAFETSDAPFDRFLLARCDENMQLLGYTQLADVDAFVAVVRSPEEERIIDAVEF